MIDASRIIHGLYQGGDPPPGRSLHDAGFRVLVLCAEEIQPPVSTYPGVLLYRVPLADEAHKRLSDRARYRVGRTADRLAWHVRSHERVLVTCALGINRSGLVVAATLIRLGLDPASAVDLIRRTRSPHALCNQEFERAILQGEIGRSKTRTAYAR